MCRLRPAVCIEAVTDAVGLELQFCSAAGTRLKGPADTTHRFRHQLSPIFRGKDHGIVRDKIVGIVFSYGHIDIGLGIFKALRLKGQPGLLAVKGVLPEKRVPFQLFVDDMGNLMVDGLFAHGETIQGDVGAKFLAKRVRESGKYNGGPIRLIACESGKLDDGIAQKFADEMGVPVLAPTKIVYTNSQGFMVLADDDFEAAELMHNATEKWNPDGWRVFEPKGG